jgi:hypothetical protein
LKFLKSNNSLQATKSIDISSPSDFQHCMSVHAEHTADGQSLLNFYLPGNNNNNSNVEPGGNKTNASTPTAAAVDETPHFVNNNNTHKTSMNNLTSNAGSTPTASSAHQILSQSPSMRPKITLQPSIDRSSGSGGQRSNSMYPSSNNAAVAAAAVVVMPTATAAGYTSHLSPNRSPRDRLQTKSISVDHTSHSSATANLSAGGGGNLLGSSMIGGQYDSGRSINNNNSSSGHSSRSKATSARHLADSPHFHRNLSVIFSSFNGLV